MTEAFSPPREERLILVDGYAIIYRAFFALISRPLTTGRGENTSAAWGVANFLQRVVSKHQPRYLGWVQDSGLSFRHEQYAAYKATREKLSAELQADFDHGVDRIEEMLAAYRIPVLKVEGYEADDVIGTLADQAVKKGLNVIIVSGDKDFHQLIAPNIWLLNPGRGGPTGVDEQWIGMDNRTARLGIVPERVTDYLALVGDSSDNVPGVTGIGDKTAIELISEFGSLEEILAHTGEIKKKRVREALIGEAAIARLSKSLVTIRKDVNIELNLDALLVSEPDMTRLRELFLELEFTGLARAIAEPLDVKEGGSVVSRQANYRTLRTQCDVEDLVRRAKLVGRIVFDTETVGEPDAPNAVDPLRSILVGLTIGLGPGEAYYLPLRHRISNDAQPSLRLGETGQPSATAGETSGEDRYVNMPPLHSADMAGIRELLTEQTIKKVAQNAKYDLLVLQREGIEVAPLEFDTMVASYVLDPGRRSHGLETLALEFLGHSMIPYQAVCGKGKTAVGFDMVSIPVATEYSCEDADVTLRLASIFQEQLETLGLAQLFHEIEMPLVPVLAAMELTGIRIDLSAFAKLKKKLAEEQKRAERRIHEIAGGEFNINSNLQLRQILFEKLKLPVIKRTSTGPSTDASVLERLAEAGHELPALLIEYRELTKLQNTYIDALPALVNPHTGRLHTSFNQTVAATGRLSSSDPNLQNIPIRRELGREIRRAFIPREGWIMVSADYSQIELRLLAHLSHDVAFVENFRKGGDIHRETAAGIFGVRLDAVTPEMRSRAKTINFATLYGQGAHALSEQLQIGHAEAKEFIDRYFARFTGVRAYLDAVVESARMLGYAETIFGRRRYIPELQDKNFNIRAFGERTAQNTPIQGSAADLIKIAMIRIAARLARERLGAVMLLQVHDELVFEAPPWELGEVIALAKEEMEGAARLDVPLVVDIGSGLNWVDAKA